MYICVFVYFNVLPLACAVGHVCLLLPIAFGYIYVDVCVCVYIKYLWVWERICVSECLPSQIQTWALDISRLHRWHLVGNVTKRQSILLLLLDSQMHLDPGLPAYVPHRPFLPLQPFNFASQHPFFHDISLRFPTISPTIFHFPTPRSPFFGPSWHWWCAIYFRSRLSSVSFRPFRPAALIKHLCYEIYTEQLTHNIHTLIRIHSDLHAGDYFICIFRFWLLFTGCIYIHPVSFWLAVLIL